MSVLSTQVPVSTVAATLIAIRGGNFQRTIPVLLVNLGPTRVFLGASGVTTANGTPLSSGGARETVRLFESDSLFGLTSSGTTSTIAALRGGV